MSVQGDSIVYHPIPNLVITQNPSFGGPEPPQFNYAQHSDGHFETHLENQPEPMFMTPVEPREPFLETEENEIRACGLRTLHRSVIVGILLAMFAVVAQALYCFVYIPSLPSSITTLLPSWFYSYAYTSMGVHVAPILGAVCVLTGEYIGNHMGSAQCHQQPGQQQCRRKSLCTIIFYAITAAALFVFRILDFIFVAVLSPNLFQLAGRALYILALVKVLLLIFQAAKLRVNSNQAAAALQDGEIEMTQH
jgi:hypothetical protein